MRLQVFYMEINSNRKNNWIGNCMENIYFNYWILNIHRGISKVIKIITVMMKALTNF